MRLLFAYFSSAFNKMQPHILINRLASYFILPHHILLLPFKLVNRQSSVGFCQWSHVPSYHFKHWFSSGLYCFTSAFDHVYRQLQVFQQGSFLVKFSADTAVLSLLQGPEFDHGCALKFIK